MKPVEDPLIGQAVAEHLQVLNWIDGPLETAAGTPFRASEALMCSRKIAYRVTGAIGREYDSAALNNFWIGHRVHSLVQDALVASDPKWEIEKIVTFDPPYDKIISAHADAYHPANGVVVEIKTVGSSQWQMASGIPIGYKKQTAEAKGPKIAHLAQGALSAIGTKASWVVIGYASKEAISIGRAEKLGLSEIARWWSEWWFPIQEVRHLAEMELDRLMQLDHMLSKGLTPREIPPLSCDSESGFSPLTPGSGWECDYCEYSGDCFGSEKG